MNIVSSDLTSNNLTFKVNSVDAIKVATNGNVGIGTSTPNAQLQLANTIANRKIVLWENANDDHQYFGFGVNASALRYQTNGDHVFYTNASSTSSTELMRITSTGRIGVGISSPSMALDVSGTTTINAGNQNTIPGLLIKGGGPGSNIASGLHLQNTGTNGNTYRFYSDENGHLQINKSTGLTGITLMNNGYVGIGISNPSYPLHVVGNTGAVTLYGALFNGNGSNAVGNSTITISAKFNNSVLSEGLICLSSDKRIKKSIISLDNNTSVECLRKINTVSYKYIDNSIHPDSEICGFIAQEIKEHMPNAVSTSKDYIPNLYSLVTVSKFEHNVWKVSLKQSFLEEGKFVFYPNKDNSGNEYVDSEGNPFSDDNGNQRFKIKLFSFSNNQGNEIICYTYKLLTDTEFLIDGTTTTEIEEKDYFLYGQYVEDKLVLNYNYIWTVCVSSVKEIDRQQQADKVRIAELEKEVRSNNERILRLEKLLLGDHLA